MTCELYLNTYNCKNESEIRNAYGAWAPTYDQQMTELNWQAPTQIAYLLSEYISIQSRNNARILDVGAGTGLVGVALQQLGFSTIDAFDISHDMLQQAKNREVYKNIFIGNAEQLPDFVPKNYDALVCVGALNFGHIAPQALHEFIKVVKPGGYISFSTREDYYNNASSTIQLQLETKQSWRRIVERVQKTAICDMPHIHWLYQKLLNRNILH